jgi:AbrB family looped-hinge helix DNA binding protein
MRATIDRAGRIVVPKALRDALSLRGGETLELTVRDGRLEAEPVATPMRLERRPDGVVAVPEQELPPLTGEQVRATLEQTRR